MPNFKIVPLTASYANKIRKTLKDDFGHKVVLQTATGYGPCRVSLKPFVPGKDKRMLLSHSPFEIDNVFNQPGPIFINAAETEPYKDVYRFTQEIKKDKEHFNLTLIGYSETQQMVFTKLVDDDEDIDELIPEIFENHPEVLFLHARNAEACCFICKIERV